MPGQNKTVPNSGPLNGLLQKRQVITAADNHEFKIFRHLRGCTNNKIMTLVVADKGHIAHQDIIRADLILLSDLSPVLLGKTKTLLIDTG